MDCMKNDFVMTYKSTLGQKKELPYMILFPNRRTIWIRRRILRWNTKEEVIRRRNLAIM